MHGYHIPDTVEHTFTQSPQSKPVSISTLTLKLRAGLFVNLEGYQRHGLVHCSQVSEEISFGQEDDDDDKIAALEYFYPTAAKVQT